MAHRHGERHQRLDSPQRFGKLEELRAVENALGLGPSAADVEADHPAEALLLPPRQLVMGMAGKPRVIDALDGGMFAEHLGHRLRASLVGLHARAERLDASQHQPGVEWRAGDAQRIDDIGDPLGMRLVSRDDAAPDDVRMAVEVLRRRMHDHVDSELERPLQIGGQKRVVGNRDDARFTGDLRHGGQIDKVQQRDCWAFRSKSPWSPG